MRFFKFEEMLPPPKSDNHLSDWPCLITQGEKQQHMKLDCDDGSHSIYLLRVTKRSWTPKFEDDTTTSAAKSNVRNYRLA